MTPVQRIQQSYRNSGWDDTFATDLRTHHHTGYILSTPEYFVMWRRIDSRWPLERASDARLFSLTGNAAWVWAVSGDIVAATQRVMELSPWMEYIGYHRRMQPRFIRRDKLAKRLGI